MKSHYKGFLLKKYKKPSLDVYESLSQTLLVGFTKDKKMNSIIMVLERLLIPQTDIVTLCQDIIEIHGDPLCISKNP